MPLAGQGRVQQVLTPEVLARLYVDEQLSADAIAAEYGTNRTTVFKLIGHYGLRKRVTGPGVAAHIDPDELYRLRHVENASRDEIAVRLGVSPGSAWEWMRRYGIPRRPRTKRQAAATPPPTPWVSQKVLTTMWEEGWSAQRIAELAGIEADAVRRRLEAAGVLSKRGMHDYQLIGEPSDPLSRKLLENMYLVEGLSAYEIARATGTTPRKVDYRLTRYGIPRRQGPGRPLKDLTPEVLEELYVDQQRSTCDIADILECSAEHVAMVMRTHGIAARPGAVRTSGGRTPLTAELLRRLHVDEALSAEQIAEKLDYRSPAGVPSTGRVRNALKRHGISLPHAERVVDDEALRRLYHDEGLDEAAIAGRLGWRTPHGGPSLRQIKQRMKEAGIEPRSVPVKRPLAAINVEIRRLYEQEGLTKREIAARLGWYAADGTPAGGRVAKRLATAGIEPGWRPPSRLVCDRMELRRLYEDEGLTLREVAVRLGWLGPSGKPLANRVQRALQEAGIHSRRLTAL